MSESEEETGYKLRNNRYYLLSDGNQESPGYSPPSDRYLHSRSRNINYDQYPRSQKKDKIKENSETPQRNKYDNMQSMTSSTSKSDPTNEDRNIESEEDTLKRWNEASIPELMDEYDKLQKKKQKGTADEVRKLREKLIERVQELEEIKIKERKEKLDLHEAMDTIEELQETIKQKDKEIKMFQDVELDDIGSLSLSNTLQIAKELEELLQTLKSYTNIDQHEEVEDVMKNIRQRIYLFQNEYNYIRESRVIWKTECEGYEQIDEQYTNLKERLEEQYTDIVTRLEKNEQLIGQCYGTATSSNSGRVQLEQRNQGNRQSPDEGGTYAGALLRGTVWKPAIVVKARDASYTAKDIREALTKELRAAIPTKVRCRQTTVGNLVISSDNEKDIEKFQQQIENNENLTTKLNIHKITPKRQKLIIFGAPHIDIIGEVVDKDQQNKEKIYNETILKPAMQEALQTEQPDYVIKKILYSNKNTETIDLVIDVTKSDSDLLKTKQLYIGLNRCRAKNFIDTPRCYRCQGFGHLARDCVNEENCAKCAGSHNTKNCKSSKICCINCQNINKEHSNKGKQLDIDHYAYENKCSTYRQYQRHCFAQQNK